jgi:hypothetical protein
MAVPSSKLLSLLRKDKVKVDIKHGPFSWQSITDKSCSFLFGVFLITGQVMRKTLSGLSGLWKNILFMLKSMRDKSRNDVL